MHGEDGVPVEFECLLAEASPASLAAIGSISPAGSGSLRPHSLRRSGTAGQQGLECMAHDQVDKTPWTCSA